MAPNLLRALAWTTDVPAAHRALEAHSDELALELGKNYNLDPATWTRLWKAHRSPDWRQALVLARLDPARQDLVIARERDLDILRLFYCANPHLTDAQKARMRYHDPDRTPAHAHARLMGILDAIGDDMILPHIPRPTQTPAERATLARTAVAIADVIATAVPHARWLTTELTDDTDDTWTACITLIAGGYTGTLTELVTTSRLLAAPERTVTLSASTGTPRIDTTRTP